MLHRCHINIATPLLGFLGAVAVILGTSGVAKAGQVTIISQKWHRAYSILSADLTIQNDNANSVKDIEIWCNFYGKSGTLIHSNPAIIYDKIPPNSLKTFNKVNIGLIDPQANSADCRVIKASGDQ